MCVKNRRFLKIKKTNLKLLFACKCQDLDEIINVICDSFPEI